jgi:hypothetical protein
MAVVAFWLSCSAHGNKLRILPTALEFPAIHAISTELTAVCRPLNDLIGD